MSERTDILKIAFVGTSCVGKTTLIEEYRKRKLPGLAIVEEASSEFFIKYPYIVGRFSAITQGEIQSLALRNEQAAQSSRATRIICDRSVLDAVAYVRSQGDIKGSKRLLEKIRFWVPTYHSLLLLDPAGIPYKTNSVRQEDEEAREKFHQAFLEMFKETDIPYELLSGTTEQRVSRVDQLLKL